MRNPRTLILWCLLIVLGLSAVGCNTVRGMGKDIERAGEAIQDASR
jgi:predicted small secreted protein